MDKTPWEIAEAWYREEDIANAIERRDKNELGSWRAIPHDIESRAFANWLTHQYRLAMAKGIQIGRQEQHR